MDRLHAHTPNDKCEWHYLDQHLKEVAEKAKEFAEKFGAGELAYNIGLLHDLGKINPCFQDYLDACAKKLQHKKVPHSIWGAALVYHFIWNMQKDPEGWKELSLAIMGHHAGLSDLGNAVTKLSAFLKESPSSLEQMQNGIKTLKLPLQSFSLTGNDVNNASTRRELFIRMLFSALVDADYLNTEKHFNPKQANMRQGWQTLDMLWKKLETTQRKILNDSTPLNRIRKEVYEACLSSATSEPGIYSLTVPTGGGKTLSGLAFALKHASIHKQMTRVIVAIPYTSIIDQTAQVYGEIFGNDAVLEHHSAMETSIDSEDRKKDRQDERQDERSVRRNLATENWDAHLIVTTTVQLFESLFSNKPSKVRKLHRITRSIIILDEVQTLPLELLRPTLDVVRALAAPVEKGGYGSTVVLCTATQPAYEDSAWIEELHGVPVHEIVPQYPDHFAVLKRVKYVYYRRPLSWGRLARKVSGAAQAMVVLNSRKDALDLITAMNGVADTFHLSTLLCGAHRKKTLEEIKKRLNPEDPKPVRLISTQVVEAGVNLDFPIVCRAVGPLDRIVQAAGRCNRENCHKKGRVFIFEPKEGRAPKGPYMIGMEQAKLLLRENSAERLHDPDLYKQYFSMLYNHFRREGLDKNEIQKFREDLNYPKTAEKYRLIPKETVAVVVPYEDAIDRFAAWEAVPSRATWRALQPYLVNLYRHEVGQKKDWLEQCAEGLYLWKGKYDKKIGIIEGYTDPSDLIV
ncbi:MAG: CRISPR-associated endonuclease Cas3'' [Syntrophobacterales bacterium]|jgi:CRISPR-associated endonuclease/helicase Cas3|nr:CRISPR-associated endonuclease Cas3'' [Syntrophobacterales bacterium]